MSLENVYANVKVRPRENRFSSFICSASYSESATLSRKRATLVNRANARNNCCWAMVGCPREDEVGICPEYGLGTLTVKADPIARFAAGTWFRLDSGSPRCVFFDPRYPISKLTSRPRVFWTVKFHCCE